MCLSSSLGLATGLVEAKPWIPPIVRKTGFQSQVTSYQRLLKWYLIPPCLTPSNIRYVSRVKWSNPGKGVTPSPTLRCSSYSKGSLLVALDNGRQLPCLKLDLMSHSFLWWNWVDTNNTYAPGWGFVDPPSNIQGASRILSNSIQYAFFSD